MRVFKEFGAYLKEHKKMWLIPILVILALLAIVIIISQTPALAPLIYSIF